MRWLIEWRARRQAAREARETAAQYEFAARFFARSADVEAEIAAELPLDSAERILARMRQTLAECRASACRAAAGGDNEGAEAHHREGDYWADRIKQYSVMGVRETAH